MTDNEIIKALECCARGDCNSCPVRKLGNCVDDTLKEALALINRQKAEIERLKEDNEALNSAVDSALDIVNSNHEIGRIDGIKEFAERLKGHRNGNYIFISTELLDNHVNEMVGANNDDK